MIYQRQSDQSGIGVLFEITILSEEFNPVTKQAKFWVKAGLQWRRPAADIDFQYLSFINSTLHASV